MKLVKEEWIKSKCRQIDNDLKRGDHSKITYNTIKFITYTKSKITSTIEDKDSSPLADDYGDGLNSAAISTITLLNLL